MILWVQQLMSLPAMNRWLSSRIVFSAIAATILAGCANPAPRYQSIQRYELPTDPEGLVCMGKCVQKIEACQQRCTANYQSCLKLIEPQVDERYSEALRRYETELDRYRGELERYQLYQSMGWGYSPWHGYGYYRPWPDPYYFPPALPRKPIRDEEANRLRQEKCDVDCGCQVIADTCSAACGSKRINEVRCVVNCPEKK